METAATDVLKIAAFSEGDRGGNPAGVVVRAQLPATDTMQRIAAEVGFSETVFAAPHGTGWRVRYFSPECEVPFCGHATIALGAALALSHGDGTFTLELNQAAITVEGSCEGGTLRSALQSPDTRSEAAEPELLRAALQLFGYELADLDPRIPVALAQAGAHHLIIALTSRQQLSQMQYDFHAGQSLMRQAGLATIAIIQAETPTLFHARNPFASGGVYEDPATGAAAAALAGYLRDIGWLDAGAITVIQGEDMGVRSRLRAEFTHRRGSSIRVSGTARLMQP